MKLLVYGGCHAAIIKSLIDKLGPPGRHVVDTLINFQLIASGRPFPEESLRTYDAVLFSPIENKGAYNTGELKRLCRDTGVPAIAFPWLEWRGYAPTAEKGDFWGQRQWFYPELLAVREDFPTFEAFAEFVRESYPSDETIAWNSGCSTGMLRELEARNACDVTVSGLIEEQFRDRRLFVTSDHPSIVLYRSVIEQSERLLGARLVETWPADMAEVQTEERTPILPRVRAWHGLRFADEGWRAANQPAQDADLQSYLALCYFAHTSELATACRDTQVRGESEPERPGRPIAVPCATRILIRRTRESDVDRSADDHFAGDIVSAIGGPPALDRGRHLFRKDDWRCSS